MVLAGLLACFYQVIILVAGDIWPPVAMVHEIFATNYFALGFRWITPFFIETGHGALALLAYPAYVVAALLGDSGDLFQRMALFGIVFHMLVGGWAFAIFWFLWRRVNRPREALLLLCIPLAPLALEPASVLNLTINYSRAQEIIAMATAALLIVKFVDWDFSERRLAIAAGVLLGIALSVKFTNIVWIGPFLIAVALPREINYRSVWFHAVGFAVAAAVSFVIVIALYVMFSWRLREFDLFKIYDLYTIAGWVRQNTPFLITDLLSLSPSSHYFALKIAAGALLALLVILSIKWCQQSLWERLATVLILVPIPFLIWLLLVRAALGTMLDIVLYVALAFVVTSVAISARRLSTVIGFIVIVLVSSVFIVEVRPDKLLSDLRHNSKLASEIDALSADDMPVVFYQNGLPQPTLFPASRQICIFKAAGAVPSSQYHILIAELCPNTSAASPDHPLRPEAHIAIVPEYLVGLPESPLIDREWPGKWPKYIVDFIALDPTGRLNQQNCSIFQFRELFSAADSLLYYSSYPTKVTVCSVVAVD